GISGSCKIGTSSTLGSRYRQARCHTPRGIQVEAFFDLGSRERVKLAESAVKRHLADVRRPGDGKEWFDVAPVVAMDRIRSLPELALARLLTAKEPKLRPAD